MLTVEGIEIHAHRSTRLGDENRVWGTRPIRNMHSLNTALKSPRGDSQRAREFRAIWGIGQW